MRVTMKTLNNISFFYVFFKDLNQEIEIGILGYFTKVFSQAGIPQGYFTKWQLSMWQLSKCASATSQVVLAAALGPP